MEITEMSDILVRRYSEYAKESKRHYTACRRLQALTFFLTIVAVVAAVTNYWTVFWVVLAALLLSIDLALWIVRKLANSLEGGAVALAKILALQACREVMPQIIEVQSALSQNSTPAPELGPRDYSIN